MPRAAEKHPALSRGPVTPFLSSFPVFAVYIVLFSLAQLHLAPVPARTVSAAVARAIPERNAALRGLRAAETGAQPCVYLNITLIHPRA